VWNSARPDFILPALGEMLMMLIESSGFHGDFMVLLDRISPNISPHISPRKMVTDDLLHPEKW
jgi:hypothetical protein